MPRTRHACQHPINPLRPRQCAICRALGMRLYRMTHPMTAEQRRKSNARAYAHVYLKRGKLQRKPCEVCGARAQMHHRDYSKPLEVTWLCRSHHLLVHKLTSVALPAPL